MPQISTARTFAVLASLILLLGCSSTVEPNADEVVYPPWADGTYDQRLADAVDSSYQMTAACMAEAGYEFTAFSVELTPMRYRAGIGSMTAERADVYAYGATFSGAMSAVTREAVAGLRRGDRYGEVLMGANGSPGCSGMARDARLASAGDFLDPGLPETTVVRDEQIMRFESTVEYRDWSVAWAACMRDQGVDLRIDDPFDHQQATHAVLAGRLASQEIVVDTKPAGHAFTLDWFARAIADSTVLQEAFEAERSIARIDAQCTSQTQSGLQAAIDAADFE